MRKFFLTMAVLISGLLPVLAQNWVAVTPTSEPIAESSIPSTGLVLDFTLTHPSNAINDGEFYAVYGPKLTFAGTSLSKSDFTCTCADGSEKASINIKKSVFTKAGDLVISFAEGNYAWTPTSGYFLDSNPASFTYNITAGAAAVSGWSCTPENGSSIDVPSGALTLKFQYAGATDADYVSSIYEVVKLDDKTLNYDYDYAVASADGILTIQLHAGIAQAGTLNITLPAGQYKGSPELNYSLTLLGATVAPAAENVWISQTDEDQPIDINSLSVNGLELKYTVNPPSQYTCTGYGFDTYLPTATLNGNPVALDLATNDSQKFFIATIANSNLAAGELVVTIPDAYGYWWCNAPEGYLDTPAATFKYTLTGGGETPNPTESAVWTSWRPEDMDIQVADLGSAGLMLNFEPTASAVAGQTVLSFDSYMGIDCVTVKLNDNVISNRTISEDETNKMLTVTIPKASLDASGVLSVTIKEAYAYWYDPTNSSYTDIPEKTFKFNVVAPAATPTSFNIVPTPAAGSVLEPVEVLNDGKSVRYAIEITSDLEGNPTISESYNIFTDMLIEGGVFSCATTVDELTDDAFTYEAVNPNPMNQSGTFRFVFQLAGDNTNKVTLSFPAGSWSTNKAPILNCNAADFEYTPSGYVAPAPACPYLLSPASGLEVNSLERFTFYVTFPGVADLDVVAESLIAKDASGETAAPTVRYTSMPNTLGFTLPLNPDSWYEVTFPAGSFDFYDANYQSIGSNVEFTWKGTANSAVPAYTVTPAQGKLMDSPFTNEFGVEFNETNVTLSEDLDILRGANVTYNGVTHMYADSYFEADDITKFIFDEALTGKGDVTVNFPAGFWDVNGTPSPAINWTFAIAEPALIYTFSPANNTSVQTLKSYDVTFGPEASVSAVALNESVAAGYTVTDGTNTYKYGEDFNINVEGLKATFTFNNEIAQQCTLNAKLVEGLFNITRPSGEVASAQKAWTINVEGVAQNYTLSPAAGAYDVYPEVVITYENCTNIVLSDNAKAVLYYGTPGPYASYNFPCTVTTDGVNTITIKTVNPVSQQPASQYSQPQLQLEAGSAMLTINGMVVSNNVVTIKDYTITPPTAPELTFAPAAGSDVESVDALKKVSITLPEGYGFTGIQAMFKKAYLYKKGVDGAEDVIVFAYNEKKAVNNADGKPTEFLMQYTGTDLAADGNGDYYVWIQDALFYTGEIAANYSPRFNYGNYTVDYTVGTGVGVGALQEANNYDIYTMTGVCVARKATADFLKQLTPGLYIINGKKTMVR